MSDLDEHLLQHLGGPEKLQTIVDDMYSRVLNDPELRGFFADTEMSRLRKMQHQFLQSAFGGEVAYTGAELTAAHANRGITSHHYASFCGHFADAMQTHGLDPVVIDRALGRLAIFKDRVTGDANVDG
ncbi:MAG: group 1 truncated hemoglobin [Planctomycetota bacterium]